MFCVTDEDVTVTKSVLRSAPTERSISKGSVAKIFPENDVVSLEVIVILRSPSPQGKTHLRTIVRGQTEDAFYVQM